MRSSQIYGETHVPTSFAPTSVMARYGSTECGSVPTLWSHIQETNRCAHHETSTKYHPIVTRTGHSSSTMTIVCSAGLPNNNDDDNMMSRTSYGRSDVRSRLSGLYRVNKVRGCEFPQWTNHCFVLVKSFAFFVFVIWLSVDRCFCKKCLLYVGGTCNETEKLMVERV